MTRTLVLLALVVSIAGCLGAASGPGIPQDALRAEGWSAADAPSTNVLYGVAEVVTRSYGPGGSASVGGAFVVSVTDVPILDESRFVPEQVDRYAASQGITLVPTGSETLALPNVDGATGKATLYDVEGADLPAKAIVVETKCEEPDAFVVAVGYGALPTSGGLLGGGGADFYGQARDLVAQVACRA